MTDELIERLALVSHLTWEGHCEEDGVPRDQISREVTEHDVERAEDAIAVIGAAASFDDLVNALAKTSRAAYVKQARRRALARAATARRVLDDARATVSALANEPSPMDVKRNRERAADMANALQELGEYPKTAPAHPGT